MYIHYAELLKKIIVHLFYEFQFIAFSLTFKLQYRSKVTYHLSSRFSRDASCFSRDASRFSRDASRFSRDESRFSRDASRFSRESLNRSVWNKLLAKSVLRLQGFKDFRPATRFSNAKFVDF